MSLGNFLESAIILKLMAMTAGCLIMGNACRDFSLPSKALVKRHRVLRGQLGTFGTGSHVGWLN